MKKIVSMVVFCAMLMPLITIGISPSIFANDSIVLLEETYKGGDYSDDDLGSLGWRALGSDVNKDFNTANGTLSLSKQNGVRMTRVGASTSSSNVFYYGVGKELSVTKEVAGDPHMSLRRYNFKGKYDVELGMRHTMLNGLNNQFQIHFGPVYYECVYGQLYYNSNNNGYGQNNPSGLNTTYSDFNSRLKTSIDTGAGEFQTYYSLATGTGTPAEPKLLANAGGIDKFATTGGFINGLQFRLSKRSLDNSFINVDWLKLTEHRKDNDATDDVLNSLNTAVLTDSPDEVVSSINLPSAAELGVGGAEIIWSSSNPSVISNDGLTVYRPAVDTEVIMTAKIVNIEDGFTQYADFKLNVPADLTDVAQVYARLDYELLTSEESSAITSDLTLPLSIDGYDGVSITWESDNEAITVNNTAGKGTVTRPSDRTNANVTLTAAITDGSLTAYKEFNFTVLTTYIVPPPKVLINELYKNGEYTNENLSGLGWQAAPEYAANGTVNIDTSKGLVLTKTKAPGTNNRNVFNVERYLSVSQPIDGDQYMAVRRESFKGIYDVDLNIVINSNSSGYWRFVHFNGKNAAGSKAALLTYRFDNAFKSGTGGAFSFPGLSWGSISIKTRINSYDGKWQMFYNGSESPRESNQSLTEFDLTAAKYLTYLDFQFDERLPNSVSNFINIESLKLTEIERLKDSTDDALAKLSTAMLTGGGGSDVNIITEKLNLPTGFDDIPGVTVKWVSSNPSLVSDSGRILELPSEQMPIMMTAEVRNNADGFTQYAEFSLILSEDAALTGSIQNVVVDGNKLTLTFYNDTGTLLQNPWVAAILYSSDKKLEAIGIPVSPVGNLADGSGASVAIEFDNDVDIESYDYRLLFWESLETLKPLRLFTPPTRD